MFNLPVQSSGSNYLNYFSIGTVPPPSGHRRDGGGARPHTAERWPSTFDIFITSQKRQWMAGVRGAVRRRCGLVVILPSCYKQVV